MKHTALLIIASITFSQMAFADTKIVIESSEGSFTTWSNNKYLRTTQTKVKQPKKRSSQYNSDEEMSNEMPGDMFGDLAKKKTYFIIEKDKILMDMSSPMLFGGLAGQQKPRPLNIEFKNKGTGKTVAGLKTTKFDIIVEGKKCFEVLSTKNSAYASLVQSYDSLSSEQGNMDDICDQAESQMSDKQYSKYGYAVKSINKYGEVDLLVKEFKTNVKAPNKFLSFPKGYKVMTMMEAMSKAMKSGNFQQ